MKITAKTPGNDQKLLEFECVSCIFFVRVSIYIYVIVCFSVFGLIKRKKYVCANLIYPPVVVCNLVDSNWRAASSVRLTSKT